MRRMATLLALLLIVARPAGATDVPIGEPFLLEIGESVEVGDLPLTVRLDAILSDSRCPIEVFCVWEGEVTAELTLSSPDGTSAVVEIHTRHSPFGPSQVAFAQHVVTMREVSPYPVQPVPIDPQEYRVELITHPQTALPARLDSWSSLKGLFR